MTVETATDVTQLNSSYPESTSTVGRGDDHIRLIKSCLTYTFAGATSTGVIGFNVYTQAAGNNTTLAASTAFVGAAVATAAFSATLPAGSNGQVLYTTAGVPAWGSLPAKNGSKLYLATNFGGF